MTFTDPTPPTADDNSPAALLAKIRRDYTDTRTRIAQLTEERRRTLEAHAAANTAHMKQMTELNKDLADTKAAHKELGRMLPRGDTARGNGTQ